MRCSKGGPEPNCLVFGTIRFGKKPNTNEYFENFTELNRTQTIFFRNIPNLIRTIFFHNIPNRTRTILFHNIPNRTEYSTARTGTEPNTKNPVRMLLYEIAYIFTVSLKKTTNFLDYAYFGRKSGFELMK